jgi:hypothetical protein
VKKSFQSTFSQTLSLNFFVLKARFEWLFLGHQKVLMKQTFLLLTAFFLVFSAHAQNQASPLNMENMLRSITSTKYPRNHLHPEILSSVANYIQTEFGKYTRRTELQDFEVNNQTYYNVIASFGPDTAERIIIGAHYDVCGNQQGADDNASGVVGLLELARMLKYQDLKYRIDLVAYSLEEPPYFRSENMGSFVHAKYLNENNIPVFGMISLEMIGFFKDGKNTQRYPLNFLKLFYGSRGNYITLVNKMVSGKFARKFTKKYKKTKSIRSKKFKAPQSLTGIDFSDHLNYWYFGFSALMITDTSFYRSPHYHQKTDTPETLDYVRMARVIDGVFQTLKRLNN